MMQDLPQEGGSFFAFMVQISVWRVVRLRERDKDRFAIGMGNGGWEDVTSTLDEDNNNKNRYYKIGKD
jgi:hypothetical protein